MDFILEGIKEAFFLLLNLDDETLSAIIITIKSSTLSIFLSLIIGLPLGFVLGFFEFRFRKSLKLFFDTLLAMPTVVIGLMVYAFLSYRGPLGEFNMLYSIKAIVIGQTLLALPIIIALSANAVEGMEKKLYLTLASFGLTLSQMIKSVIWELRHTFAAVAVTAYGRIVAEVGVAMMLGGNIKWHTRTITTAISLETGKGEFSMGIALGIVLILIAFAANMTLYFLKKRSGIR